VSYSAVKEEAVMRNAWFAVEHHRLHVIEEWPDGPQKEAALEAVRSSLAQLSGKIAGGIPACIVCADRGPSSNVAVLGPQLLQIEPLVDDERAA